MARRLRVDMVILSPWSARSFMFSEDRLTGSSSTTFGLSTSTHVSQVYWVRDWTKSPSSHLAVRSKAAWELVEPVNGSPQPPKRSGHVCATYGEKIFLCVKQSVFPFLFLTISISSSFGGTDGQYHYNDTWFFDTTTKNWNHLAPIGPYIPSPREGHTAAVVEDVIYVFGGRGVDGKELGSVRAFSATGPCCE